jgi:hypothetical protein
MKREAQDRSPEARAQGSRMNIGMNIRIDPLH